MTDDFYRTFEERYYAPRETIKDLRRQYLPFVTPLVALYPGAPTFDAGCGRGEWLELMLEVGLSPYGVDLDDGMLKACEEGGLPAEKGDAIAYLTTLPSESRAVITAFHVVEHISFEQLRTFVREAIRVLKPGGLLIMETPNPENIQVATQNFYLDPTHQRPIPPRLLSFVAEFSGFKRVKTLRLQESRELIEGKDVSLLDVLQGASPDYAVIAQKDAESGVLALTAGPFNREYGLTLDALAIRHHNALLSRIEQIKALAMQAEAKAQQAENTAQQAISRADVAEAERDAVFNSRSWRLTLPLRWLGLQARRLRDQGLKGRLVALAKKIARPLARRAVAMVDRHPGLRHAIIALTQRIGIYGVLRARYRRASGEIASLPSTVRQIHLSPSAEDIYKQLKAAIQQHGDIR